MFSRFCLLDSRNKQVAPNLAASLRHRPLDASPRTHLVRGEPIDQSSGNLVAKR